MKNILYIECNAGISGDMTLGALVDLGADIEKIKKELSKLDMGADWQIIPSNIKKSGIGGVDLDVVIGHSHTHGHGNNHEHNHEHNSFRIIREMIEHSDLNEHVKATAVNIFTIIAKAEAAVHKMDIEDVTFHEVGAVDSIIDIVGASIAVDMLDVDEIYCSQVHDGSGFIDCQHGIIPVPVPAVMEMMKNSRIPVVINEEIRTEMVTPTGFGILEGLGAVFISGLEFVVEDVGYGFGKRDTGLFNAVRIVKGTLPE